MDITISEASRLTGAPEVTLRRWAREEKVKSTKTEDGSHLLDKRDLLLQFPTVFNLFIQKGGTGKTALASLLVDYYSDMGLKVLLVGLDPQVNVEQRFFDYAYLKEQKSLYDYFENKTSLSKIVLSYNDNIDVLPSSRHLERKRFQFDVFDMEDFVSDFHSFYKKYDIVIQDCGPVVDSLSKFGIMTAHYTLLPFVPEPDSYDGVLEAILSLKQIKKYSEHFKGFKAVINNHDQSGRYGIAIHNQFKEKAISELSKFVTQSSVPSFVGVKERRTKKENLFITHKDHKFMDQVKAVLEEIDYMAFEGRK